MADLCGSESRFVGALRGLDKVVDNPKFPVRRQRDFDVAERAGPEQHDGTPNHPRLDL